MERGSVALVPVPTDCRLWWDSVVLVPVPTHWVAGHVDLSHHRLQAVVGQRCAGPSPSPHTLQAVTRQSCPAPSPHRLQAVVEQDYYVGLGPHSLGTDRVVQCLSPGIWMRFNVRMVIFFIYER